MSAAAEEPWDRGSLRGRALLGAAGLVLTAAGLWMGDGFPDEAWWFAAIVTAGMVVGSLGLLAIGHLMSDQWLAPVRAEAEAAALTTPLVLLLALPLAFDLGAIYPWAGAARPALPPAREAYLSPAFFLARACVYCALWTLFAVWFARTERPRPVGIAALMFLAPASAAWATDWALSRDPVWWSGLFGFGFVVNQLLASLALAILVTLLRFGDEEAKRMKSLERALLTLALLTLWTWFVHFLIVWFDNLPQEAAWYLARGGPRLALLLFALAALLTAVLLLAPAGVRRGTMLGGCVLVLLQHFSHTAWLLRVELSPASATVAGGLCLVWASAFAVLLTGRARIERKRE